MAKSSLPPLSKASVVVCSSIIGAGIHVGGSAINSSNYQGGGQTPTGSKTYTPPIIGGGDSSVGGTDSIISCDSVHKLLSDYDQNSALMDLILSINMITYVLF